MVVDKSNMKQVLLDFPKQCRDALSLARGIKVSGTVTKIVVCGMGGSAIGGDLLKSYMYDKLLPVFVIRDYDLPAFVDDNTLVFCLSYSGNTEETLSCLTEAKNRNAKVVTICSGGKLAELSETLISIPEGLQPRNALGYLFFPMLGVLFNSGLADVKNPELNQLIKMLSDVAYFDEKGRDIAKKVRDRIVAVYSSARMEPAAYRLKTELNENSKHPAWHHVFTELCHNELVSVQGMERSKNFILLIRSKGDHERIKKRMDICKPMFEDRADVEEILALGDSHLARLFSVIYLGDWISYHVAMLKHIDPTPVTVIEDLKRALVK